MRISYHYKKHWLLGKSRKIDVFDFEGEQKELEKILERLKIIQNP